MIKWNKKELNSLTFGGSSSVFPGSWIWTPEKATNRRIAEVMRISDQTKGY